MQKVPYCSLFGGLEKISESITLFWRWVNLCIRNLPISFGYCIFTTVLYDMCIHPPNLLYNLSTIQIIAFHKSQNAGKKIEWVEKWNNMTLSGKQTNCFQCSLLIQLIPMLYYYLFWSSVGSRVTPMQPNFLLSQKCFVKRRWEIQIASGTWRGQREGSEREAEVKQMRSVPSYEKISCFNKSWQTKFHPFNSQFFRCDSIS